MFTRVGVTIALLLACSGCAWMIGAKAYQPLDPVWTATFGSANVSGDRTLPSVKQQDAKERARGYVAQLLAETPEAFVDNLEKQKFICRPWNGWTCVYSKTREPMPCFIGHRISVEVNFPYRISRPLEVRDVDVAAMVVVDDEYHDPYCEGPM